MGQQAVPLQATANMINWKWNTFWVGKPFEYPEIMTQEKTLEELEANIKDGYLLMTMDEVSADYQVKKWGKA
jgi:predicted RNase H-like HicB family nuclease